MPMTPCRRSRLRHCSSLRRVPLNVAALACFVSIFAGYLSVSTASSSPSHLWASLSDTISAVDMFSGGDDDTMAQEERILRALAKLDELQSSNSDNIYDSSKDGNQAKLAPNNRHDEDKTDESYHLDDQIQERASTTPKLQRRTPNIVKMATARRSGRANGTRTKIDAEPVPRGESAAEQNQPNRSSVGSETSASMFQVSPWVKQFFQDCETDALMPIPRDFWLDSFNLAQLPPVLEALGQHYCVLQQQQRQRSPDCGSWSAPVLHPDGTSPSSTNYPIYRACLQLMTSDDASCDVPWYIHETARHLYCLTHQRFVLSPRGLDMVRRRLWNSMVEEEDGGELSTSTIVPHKVLNATRNPLFGTCPRLQCRRQPLLPHGLSDDVTIVVPQVAARHDAAAHALRLCPKCREVYQIVPSRVDGCAWGPSFAPLFVLTYGDDFVPTEPNKMPAKDENADLLLTLFGFPLHPTALP